MSAPSSWGEPFEFDPDDAMVPEDVCAICMQPLERGDMVQAVPPASKLLASFAHQWCREELA